MWTPKGKLISGNGVEEETLRQLEILVKNPDLRKYVTIVDLQVTVRTNSHNIAPVIAQNLSLFPNLHTLRLIYDSNSSYDTKTFSVFRYPTVHTLNLNFRSPHEDILLACPNTKHFSFNGDKGDWAHLQNCFTRDCASSVEKLGVIMRLGSYLPLLVNSLPRLRDISLYCQCLRTSDKNFDCLTSLPLHTIRLRLDDWPRAFFTNHTPATPDERRSWIDLALGILAKCPKNETAKRVIVVNEDKTVDVYYHRARRHLEVALP